MADDEIKVDVDNEDYQTWPWKEVMLAICGGHALGGDVAQTALSNTSVPMSLVNAGNDFLTATNTLEQFVRDTKKWTDALVGPNGSWTGLGAKNFATMMGNVIDVAEKLYEALSTGPDYYTTLTDAGTDLLRCINSVNETDHWAAEATIYRWKHDIVNVISEIKP